MDVNINQEEEVGDAVQKKITEDFTFALSTTKVVD
jgi:hypothetical protein